jgi:HAD superfamily hydrolase (TIGR01509 family)
MSQLRALLFDVDGTLADTEKDGHRVAFNQAFAEAGLDWNWSVEMYGKLLEVTGGKERIRHYLTTYRPELIIPSDAEIASLHATKTKYYLELIALGKVPLRPGVKRLIHEAQNQGLRLAIVTTTTMANVTNLLDKTLDPSLFEAIAAGDIVPQKKPAPDIYHYILKEMNLVPEECMAFEDSNPGLRSAMGANLTTIVTVNDYTQHQDFSAAPLVLNHFGEPDLPCTVLSGKIPDLKYLDVATVKELHSMCVS